MADLSKGFIVLSRCFDDYKYWQSPIAISLWVKILLKANWKDGWFMGVKIPRGSFATSIKNLSEEIGVSHNTITKWLKIFEKEKQISLKSTNKFTVISVVNYALFQDFEIDTGKQSGKQTGKQTGKQSGDNRTIKPFNKETKKQIKDKKIKDISPRFVRPTLQELSDYAKSISYTDFNPHYFMNYYDGNGWMAGSHKMKDWQATVRNWKIRDNKKKAEREHSSLEDLPF